MPLNRMKNLGILLLIGILSIIPIYLLLMGTYYTFFEFIPWYCMEECNNLNLTNEYVWNSPRPMPDEVKELVVKCKASTFGYSGGGTPLFYMSRYNPPEEFNYSIEWSIIDQPYIVKPKHLYT